jgi:uncharacterized protein
MLELSSRHLAWVRAILAEHVVDLEVWAFGSRVTGGAAPYSDLDLALVTDIPLSALQMGRLLEAFSESDLPIKVDVVDLAAVSPAFRAQVESRHEVVQTPPPP